MEIESTVKINHEYMAELKTFKPSDIYHIPFDEVVICVDNGEKQGPWINLVNHEAGEEFIIQFDAPNFGWSSSKDKETKTFLKAIANIIRKNRAPIKFNVDGNCTEASTKRVAV